MQTLKIVGRNYCGTPDHTRIACRGVVLRDGKVLLSHERNTGWYLIPGGGLEDGESIQDCCIRELREETGYITRPVEQFLTLEEYYGSWCYVSHYFRCEVTGQEAQQLTQLEKERGLVPEWVDLNEALALFAGHVNLGHYEEKRGSYQREHRALTCFREECL